MTRWDKVEVTVTPHRTKSMTTTSGSVAGVEASTLLQTTPGVFPLLDPQAFSGNSRRSKTSMVIRCDRQSKSIDTANHTGKPAAQISILNRSISAFKENNWQFVQGLLNECKTKTRRILLEKLGQEAVQWGHENCSFTGEYFKI